MKIAKKIMDLLADEGSSKVLTSISKEGKLHAITAGSIMAMGDDKLFVMEVFMNTTSKNIQDNNDVGILITKGAESYLIDATGTDRYTEGEYFDVMTKSMRDKGIPVKAVWTFKVNDIFDQSPTPNAGQRV